jgi:hypothetical protein
MWKGGFMIRVCTIITFALMITSKCLNVVFPYFLKLAIDGISCNPATSLTVCPANSEIYFFVGMYGAIKFSSDFANYIREIPFSVVTASAECHIAKMVYKHT